MGKQSFKLLEFKKVCFASTAWPLIHFHHDHLFIKLYLNENKTVFLSKSTISLGNS